MDQVVTFDPEAARTARVERSRRALLARCPALARHLVETGATAPVTADGAVIDIGFGDARLYRTDGRRLAGDQVARFMERPVRAFRTLPVGSNLSSHVSQHMLRALLAECQEQGIGIDQLPAEPDYAGSFLVVLGIGLGFHIPELVARTRAHHLVLVEPHGDFLYRSLATLDWATLFDTVEAANGSVAVVVPDDPARLIYDILAAIRRGPELCVDGSFIFVHYPEKALVAARDQLGQYFDVLFLSFGFYEDERIMLANALANLSQPAVRLIEAGRPVAARPEPVLIIANGPSLDRSLDHALRLRAGAMVITCGTALQTCLKKGLVPDLHCEAENVPHTVQILEHAATAFDLSGLLLLAALTVEPQVCRFFRDRLMYHREAASSTRLLARPGQEMMFSSPTVANAALRLAVALGYTNIYLFGVDFGTRQRGHHHAEGSAYQDLGFLRDYDQSMDMAHTVPGNFGGAVATDTTFNLARLSAGKIATAAGLRVINCSDGALIDGAQPRHPERLTLPPLAVPRAHIRQALLDGCRPAGADQAARAAALAQVVAQGQAYFAGLLAAIEDAAGRADGDVVAFYHRLAPYLAPDCGQDGAATLVVGSLRLLPKIAAFFLMRLPDADHRRLLFGRFVAEYRYCVETMRDDCLGLLDGLHRPLADPDTAAGPAPANRTAAPGKLDDSP